MKIAILTEGGTKIGFGHITRCISLYQAFQEKDQTPTFIINADHTISELMGNIPYKISDWSKKKEALLEIVKNYDVVIADSLLCPAHLLKKISFLGKLPVFIDDFRRLSYIKGILIDWTMLAEKSFPRKNHRIRYCLGHSYVALRKTFWDVKRKRINKTVDHIMITFGGGDTRNMTPRILKELTEYYPSLKKTVIIGKSFKNISQIKMLKNSYINFIYYPDDQKMKNIMVTSDIAISSGGQTLYELARVGVPTIGVVCDRNHLMDVENCGKVNLLENIGWWNGKRLETRLQKAIDTLMDYNIRVKRSGIGQKLVDGQGARRIAEYILKKSKEGKILNN